MPIVAAPPASAAAGSITGRVFQDFNSNGVLDTTSAIGRAIDVGVAGIEVRAFDSTGAAVGSTTSGVDGNYTLSITGAATTAVRVEFTIPSSAAYAQYRPSFVTTTGASGSSFTTSVQFATVGNTGVNFAVTKPGDYCQNNPTMVTCSADQGTGSTTNVGAFTMAAGVSGFVDYVANNSRIGSSRSLGSVFGIGADRARNTFYGTYLRRHQEYGSAGAVNAIYRINLDNPGTVTTFVTLPGTLPAHDPASLLGSVYGGDTAVFDKVGRVGLGDVDVTDDGTTLLAVDMNEAAPKLFFVPIQGSGNNVTAGTPSSIAIAKPATFGSVACPGTWHPMGIGTRGSRILVGGVCGAENTVTPTSPRGTNPTQSTAFIVEYSGARDGSGSFKTIWASPLGYARGCVYREGTRIACNPLTSTVGSMASADWAAWNDYPNLFAPDGPTAGLFASNPQAMLANIEITDSGDLVLGLRDRFHDQIKNGQVAYSLAYANSAYPAPPVPYPRGMGTMAGGEIMRVCNTASGLSSEANGTCPNLAGSQNPEAGLKEFYADGYPLWGDTIGPYHSETANGSTASMPGYPGVWSTVYDVTGLSRQGVIAFGSCTNAAAGTCRGPTTGFGSQVGGYDFGNLNSFRKGNGLADLEVVCDQAPVQIGNRLWIDTDADGIQDPGESPVVGATVRLYDTAGNLVSTTKTGANGEYYFATTVTEAANGGATPDAYGGNMTFGQAYTLRIDNPADFASGGPLAGYALTKSSATTSVAADNEASIDSNATVVSSYPRLDVAALVPGGNDHTFDAGFFPLVAVSNFAWTDTDGDGVQDAGEPGLAGTKVQLLDSNGNPALDAYGNPVPEQTTDANGQYLFDDLRPGDYRVKFVPPDGYGFTKPASTSGTAATDSDASPATGMTPVFTVLGYASGTTVADTSATTDARFVNSTVDAGFVPKVSVGDFVWLDVDRDGVQDTGETGIAGVTLTITKADGSPVTDVAGNPVSTTTTNSAGKYLFDNLPPGQYKVTVTPPAGYTATLAGQGASTALDSSTGSATSVVLGAGTTSDMTLDFGFFVPSVSVGDYVWFDTDKDGIQEAGEPPLSGVTMTITKADGSTVTDLSGNLVTSTVTDANGKYLFANLPPGQYKVSAATPTGMQPTLAEQGANTALDSSTGTATSTNLTTDGASDLTLDFGFWSPPASVGSTVWIDTNSNGLQDPGEPGLAGVTMTLTDTSGNPVVDIDGKPVGPVVTDSSGSYLFSNLPFGSAYKVTITYPDGYAPTKPNQGTNAAIDSSTTFEVTPTMSIANISNMTLDFGLLPKMSVGDYVWLDTDRDGLQDAGEEGIAGVTLSITKVDGSAVTDVYGNPVTTTTTDVNGKYSFDSLPAGQYKVTVTAPADLLPTLAGVGANTALDSSTGSATSVVLGASTTSDTSLDFGFVVPMVSVGDFVWLDTDRDGVQDAGEKGIAGVTLTITKVDGSAVTDAYGNPVTTTTTDADGKYSFENLPVGQYKVTVTPPDGYVATLPGVGLSATDSATGSATSANLTTDGARDPSLDFGFVVPMVSVGDFVWLDTDRDGVQDASENGIAGVTLTITKADGSAVTDVFGNAVTTTTTDASGKYLFENLPVGQYKVTVTAPTGLIPTITGVGTEATDSSTGSATSANLTTDGASDMSLDFGFVPPRVSVGNYVWFDKNNDGVQDATDVPLAGVTLSITKVDGSAVTDVFGNAVSTTTTDVNGKYLFENLPLGQYTVTVTPPAGYVAAKTGAGTTSTDSSTGFATSVDLTTDGASDLTLDFGFIPERVSVGDYVWRDTDRDGVQDTGEPGIAGVTVSITKVDGSAVTDVFGNPVSTTTTDANGKYVFENLPTGQYKVSVTTPAGFIPTLAGQGMSATDSSTGSATSANLTTDGASDLSLDFGFVPPRVSVGDYVWFDTNHDGVQDASEPALSGVKLSITKADGSAVIDVFGSPVTTTYTDANGAYSFANLPVGQYTVTVTTPSGMEPTVAGAGTDATDSSTGFVTSANLTVDGQRDPTMDFGFWTPPASVGSRVWADLDQDGIQDVGEPGVSGVTLTLTKADGSAVTDVDGKLVGPVVTDADGNYLFPNLPFGTAYTVTVTYPPKYVPTKAGVGSDPAVDSSTTTATSGIMNLSNINDFSLDFGIVPLVSVGDYVWRDTDRDGVQDTGEPGIAGVTLTITKTGGGAVTDVYGNPVTTVTTDANGNYLFEDLPPGQYTVTVTPPTGLLPTVATAGSASTDSSTATATSLNLTVGGSSDLTLDFGFVPPMVSVGDYVWLDTDRDGVQDASEKGISGVTLTLTKADGSAVTNVFGNPVTTTVTDANGAYSFDNLPVGQYKVTVTPPVGLIPTITGAGTDATDSSTGFATSVSLTTDGQRDATLDFGFVQPMVSVGDYVWFDKNDDGVQDSTDVPLENVTLSLTKVDGTAVTDVFGNPVTTTSTDVDGKYLFANLPLGQYTVTVGQPLGYVSAKAGAGTIANDSSTGSATSANLTSNGASDVTLDFGFVPERVSVGDLVWLDLDRDGLQDAGEKGIAGVTVEVALPDDNPVTDVFGNSVATTVTDANGEFTFDNLPPGMYKVTVTPPVGLIPTIAGVGSQTNDSSVGSVSSMSLLSDGQRDATLDFGFVQPMVSVGDYVWWDTDKDGLQDASDKPLAGVTLTLTRLEGSGTSLGMVKSGGTAVTDVFGRAVTTTKTDANGRYSFDNLPLGRYTVTCTPPAYMAATTVGAGDTSLDSSTGFATSVNLTVDGQRDPTLDFGFVTTLIPTVSLGDKVWRDVNGDGLQGPIDRGVRGATLRVFDAAGNPARDVNGKLVRAQVTGRDGKYLFTNLPPGQYTVRITYPKGLRPTIANRPGREKNSSSGSVRSLKLTRHGSVDRSLDFGVVAVDAGAPGKGMPTTR